eukprot:TRINITY_DN1111_c0_g1_i4.p1 TRINITY_DN1111_c0_g1~~TRINITY_DN1111_c0_g1_i4.p1  ORF type:complete len:142 (-),score=9.03 TRINITY_DN1111_c0_g1_i4:490-915(-)
MPPESAIVFDVHAQLGLKLRRPIRAAVRPCALPLLLTPWVVEAQQPFLLTLTVNFSTLNDGVRVIRNKPQPSNSFSIAALTWEADIPSSHAAVISHHKHKRGVALPPFSRHCTELATRPRVSYQRKSVVRAVQLGVGCWEK